MDASLTFRFPGVAVAEKKVETPPSAASTDLTETATSDENLILQIRIGSREALAVLFQRHARVVRGVAYRVLRDASEADDLLQDVFLLIDRKASLFDPSRGSGRFWILQMTYHCAIARRRHLNSRHFYTRVDLEQVENNLADPEVGTAGIRLLENPNLKRIFSTLSEDQQETLRLFFVEGYTLPEIAAKLNQSHGNVKHHYFRGVEKLRKHFFGGKLHSNSAV